MKTGYIIVLIWTLFTIANAIFDFKSMPFTDHKVRFIIRIVCAFLLWVFLVFPDKELYAFEVWLVYPSFLAFWFWWIFDTSIGLLMKRNPFYIGNTSTIDKVFNRFNWAIIWMIKFGLAIVPFSHIMNLASGYFR